MTRTTLKIEKGKRVLLTREGMYSSQMLFEQGKRHVSIYDTPYGSFTLGLDVNRLMTQLNESGGSIEVDYSIEIDHAVAGENRFSISIREPGHFAGLS